MCKSLPFISSIRLSRSLNDKPMMKFPFVSPESVVLSPEHLSFAGLRTQDYRLLVNRLPRHFFQRCHSRSYLDQAAAPQRNHSPLDRLLFQFQG